jgi:hypothetical protein
LMMAILTGWGGILVWFWFGFPLLLEMVSIFSCVFWPSEFLLLKIQFSLLAHFFWFLIFLRGTVLRLVLFLCFLDTFLRMWYFFTLFLKMCLCNRFYYSLNLEGTDISHKSTETGLCNLPHRVKHSHYWIRYWMGQMLWQSDSRMGRCLFLVSQTHEQTCLTVLPTSIMMSIKMVLSTETLDYL